MQLYALDIVLILYLFIGTAAIKKLQHLVRRKKLSPNGYLLSTLFPGVVPIIGIQSEAWAYSAVSIIVAGLCFFWFPILASRSTSAI